MEEYWTPKDIHELFRRLHDSGEMATLDDMFDLLMELVVFSSLSEERQNYLRSLVDD